MDEQDVSKHALDYLTALAQAPDFVYIDPDAQIPLEQVHILLDAMQSQQASPLARRDEIPGTPDRHDSAGIEHNKKTVDPALDVSFSRVIHENQHLVLLGEPGAGKTTALQFIGLSFARYGSNCLRDGLALDKVRIPIRILLRNYAEDYAQVRTTLQEALVGEVARRLACPEKTAEKVLEQWKKAGCLLILLDGLDEIQHLRGDLIGQVRSFCNAPHQKNIQVIVTARLTGYTSLGSPFKEFILKPLDKPEQVRQFISNWLQVLRPDLDMKDAQAEAEKLITTMKDQPALRRLMNTPLILRLAAQHYAQSGEIARTRAELYMMYMNEIWDRALERGVLQIEKESFFQTIEAIAWHIQLQSNTNRSEVIQGVLRYKGAQSEVQAEANLQTINQKMGLIVYAGGRLAFSHATFREYFVSRRLRKAWQLHRNAAWKFLRPRLHTPEWQEPIKLMVDELEETSSHDLLNAIWKAGSPYENSLHRDVLLISSLVAEGASIKPRLYQKLLARLFKLIIKEKGQDWVQASVAKALGHIASPKIVTRLLRLTMCKDSDGYDDFDVQWGARQALNNIRGTAAVKALLEGLKNPYLDIRQDAAQALGHVADPQTLPALLEALEANKEHYWVQVKIVWAIGEFADPQTLPTLLPLVDMWKYGYEIRKQAARALGRIGSSAAVPTLLQKLEGDFQFYEDAIEALKLTVAPENEADVRRLLQSEHEGLRKVGARLLQIIEAHTPAIPALSNLMEENEPPRQVAAVDQGNNWRSMPMYERIDYVRQVTRSLKRNDDPMLRLSALQAVKDLGDLADPRAIPALDDVLHDGYLPERIRGAALEALANIEDPKARPVLAESLKDINRPLYQIALDQLEEFKDHRSIPALLRAIAERNGHYAVSNTLERIAHPQYLDTFIQGLNDPNKYVREACATALGTLALPQTIPALTEALKKYEPDTRRAIATALGQIGDPQTLPDLVWEFGGESGWHGRPPTAAYAIYNVVSRWPAATDPQALKEQISMLEKIAKMSNQKEIPGFLMAVLEKVEPLKAPIFDPVFPPPPPRWKTILIWLSLGSLAGLGFGVVAVLTSVMEKTSNLVLIFIIGLIVGFSGWLLEEIRGNMRK